MYRLLVAALWVGAPALAATHEMSVGAAALTTMDFLRPHTGRIAVDAAYAYRTERWLLGGGLRYAFPRDTAALPLELYGRALLVGRMGAWAPALGPELGLTGLAVISSDTWAPGLPDDFERRQAGLLGPVYLSFHAAPLRFEIGAFTLSALELQLGANFPPLGSSLRLQVDLLHVGVRL
jgi:hypothetical protein